MRTPMTRPIRLALVSCLLCLPLTAAATVTVEFTGTVASISGDDEFFAVPNAGVGSAVNGTITYEAVPDFVWDPIQGDCEMGYLFDEGRMIITIASHVWEYNSLLLRLDDCEANDRVEFIGQGALTYPPSAPAHQLFLKLFDQVLPYDLLSSLDVPLQEEQLDLDEVTRMTGRIYNWSYGELRFQVDSVRMTGTVANGRQTWDGLKAMYR